MLKRSWSRWLLVVGLWGGLVAYHTGCTAPTTPPAEQSGQEASSETPSNSTDAGEQTLPPERPVEARPERPVEAQPEPAPEPTPKEQPPEPNKPRPTEFGGKRPVKLRLPDGYDPSQPVPLVIVLHGYGASGDLQASYLGYTLLQDSEKFLLLAPDGTIDASNRRFWNATPACCDFLNTGVDDVAYIKGLIRDVKAAYKVDPRRVYLIGHSNGGFMSYRMACDASDEIAAIVSLAGAMVPKKEQCSPSSKVSVLQVHGTNDSTVRYNGGSINAGGRGGAYASASQSVLFWGQYNGCTGSLQKGTTTYDFDTKVAGSETSLQSVNGCPQGIDAALWTIQQGGHLPGLTPSFAKATWTWLQQHPKVTQP